MGRTEWEKPCAYVWRKGNWDGSFIICHVSPQSQVQNDNNNINNVWAYLCFSNQLLLTFFKILSWDLGQAVGRWETQAVTVLKKVSKKTNQFSTVGTKTSQGDAIYTEIRKGKEKLHNFQDFQCCPNEDYITIEKITLVTEVRGELYVCPLRGSLHSLISIS